MSAEVTELLLGRYRQSSVDVPDVSERWRKRALHCNRSGTLDFHILVVHFQPKEGGVNLVEDLYCLLRSLAACKYVDT